MKYLKEFSILIFCLFLGSIMRFLINFPVPEAVYGMFFLFIFLLLNWIKIEHVENASDLLLENLAFFFVPAGVGLIEDFDKIKTTAPVILLILAISSVIGIVITAKTVIFIQKRSIKHAK